MSDSSDIASPVAIQFYTTAGIYSNIATSPSGLGCITIINRSLITTSLIIEFYPTVGHGNNNLRLCHINIGINSIAVDDCPLIAPSFIVELHPTVCNFD